jgi:hypothetical protein
VRAEILYENGGSAGKLTVPNAVLEALEAVLGLLAIEAAAVVVDIPDTAVGGREDAPEPAGEVRVEGNKQGLVRFEEDGGGCVLSLSFSEVGRHLHCQLDLGAAPGALGGDLHRVEQQAQIFCAIVGRACAGHARLHGFFYKLRAEEADYLRAVHLVDGVAARDCFARADDHCDGGAAA